MKIKNVIMPCFVVLFLMCSGGYHVVTTFVSNSDTLSVLMFKDTLNINFYYGIYQFYTHYDSAIKITEINNDNLNDTVRFLIHYSGDAYNQDTIIYPNFEWSNDTLHIWYTTGLFKQDSSSLSGQILAKELLSPAHSVIMEDSITIIKKTNLIVNVIPNKQY